MSYRIKDCYIIYCMSKKARLDKLMLRAFAVEEASVGNKNLCRSARCIFRDAENLRNAYMSQAHSAEAWLDLKIKSEPEIVDPLQKEMSKLINRLEKLENTLLIRQKRKEERA